MQGCINEGTATICREHFFTGGSYDGLPITKQSFSDFFRFHLKAQSARLGQKRTKKDIADALGISYELFRKMVNRETPTKKRDCIIAVCVLLGADSTDTGYALHCYGMEPLDEFDPRDCLLMTALDLQDRTLAAINAELTANSFPPLDIISHKSAFHPEKYPCRLVRKHFQCTVGGIGRFDNPDYYLDLLYDIESFFTLHTCMEFDDNGRRYEICIRQKEQGAFADNLYQGAVRRRIFPPQKKYIVYAYPFQDAPSELHEYDRIEDTGIFRVCFQEIEQTERTEKRRLYDTANDTRNYGRRISARVIDNEIHVFCEEYNCDIPELSEYYLMDYCGGVYTLYIARSSRFMQMYLPAERYIRLYGKPADTVTAQYASTAEIEDSAYEARDVGMYESYSSGVTVTLRIKAYRKMKSRIRALIKKLKAGEAHICNPAVFEDAALLYAYFGIRNPSEFDTFTLDELTDGFALGLRTPEEISAFLSKHRTLHISELL